MDWDELSRLPGLRSVVDSGDIEGSKSRLIDRTQKHVLRRHLRHLTGPVLDFGCGTGRLTAWLAGQGFEVVGIDSSAGMIQAAHSNVPGATFRVSDGDTIPADDATFGVIISVGVLQHLVGTKTFAPILGELGRVLKPDGTLLAIEHVGNGASLRRGGQPEQYADGLAEAGWTIRSAYPIRRNDSRVFMFGTRFSKLPGWERAVALDARLRPRQLTETRYADHLFVARR